MGDSMKNEEFYDPDKLVWIVNISEKNCSVSIFESKSISDKGIKLLMAGQTQEL